MLAGLLRRRVLVGGGGRMLLRKVTGVDRSRAKCRQQGGKRRDSQLVL
jgi:hypothetical protein